VLTDSLVSWVRVTVHKPQAPLSVPVHDVAVTIERSRP
jgi:dihydroneopterin aldolase